MALSKANSVQSRHFHFLLSPSTAPSLYVLSGYWQRRDAVFFLDMLLSQKRRQPLPRMLLPPYTCYIAFLWIPVASSYGKTY